MRLLRKLLKTPTLAPGIVALSFFPHGFAVAISRYLEQNTPRLVHCEFIAATAQQLPQQLVTLVKSHHLEKYDCHILLAPDQYRSISIEAPAVPHDEIKQAVRWRIADFLDYPVDQATIDYYSLPKSNRANSPEMLEVFACSNQTVADLVQQCRQTGLNVKVIEVQETVLRNLATLLPENDQGIALLYLQKDSGRIIIQKRGSIYLSRKITTGYRQLTDSPAIGDTDQRYMEQDSLALEIQRSFDYVENYFDIPPITSLAVVLMPIDTQSIINFLSINYGITARAMDLSAIIVGDTLLDDATQNICAPTIGASLRRWVEQGRS